MAEQRCGLQTVASVSLAGLEPDQIPQLWTYLLNSTALSAGGTALTTTGDLARSALNPWITLKMPKCPFSLLLERLLQPKFHPRPYSTSVDLPAQLHRPVCWHTAPSPPA